MLENLTFIDRINLKIASAYFNKKIFFVNFYYCPETGNTEVFPNYNFSLNDGIKPAILIDDMTIFEFMHEYKIIDNFISYDENNSSCYSLKIIPNYTKDHVELNQAINKLIDSEEKKYLFINQLKILINSSDTFDLLNASNLQKAISLYNII